MNGSDNMAPVCYCQVWSHDPMCQRAQNSQLYHCPIVGSLLHGLIASHQQGDCTSRWLQDWGWFSESQSFCLACMSFWVQPQVLSRKEWLHMPPFSQYTFFSPWLHSSLRTLLLHALTLETSRCHLSKCCPGGWITMQLQDFHLFGDRDI